MVSNNIIKTTDVTTKSVGAQTKAKKKGAIEPTPKEQLKNIKQQKKDLNTQIKALTKEENKLKKATKKPKK